MKIKIRINPPFLFVPRAKTHWLYETKLEERTVYILARKEDLHASHCVSGISISTTPERFFFSLYGIESLVFFQTSPTRYKIKEEY